MNYNDFVDLKYKPSEDDIICLFKVTPSRGFSVKDAAIRVAAESSNGTWSNLNVPDHILKLRAKVYDIDGKWVKIAYPIDLFEKGNMSQIMSSIAGNIFGMKAVDGLRLEDVRWPKKILKSFRGPQYGIKGVRKILKIKNRPIVVSVPKPKVGYTSKEHAQVAYNAWIGGVDLVKDDENLSSQGFNRFEKRLEETMKMREKAEKETGERKSYLINITAGANEMIRRMKLVKEYGNEYVMVDILTAGWAALDAVREEAKDLKLAIHAHRAFHAAFDRNPNHGMSMKVVAEMARIIGVDQLHIGGMGKLVGGKEEVKENYIKTSLQYNREDKLMLEQDWFNMKGVLGVSSGGLHPGIVAPVMNLLGTDIALQAGGGIHGHPDGTREGAKAFREAIDAFMKGIDVREYAKEHPALKKAIKLWGTKVYK